MCIRSPWLVLAAAILLVGPALADSAGPLRVVDADTFDVGGVRVRLHGVDAPEAGQTCLDPLLRLWPCGEWATAQARAAWEGREAVCALVEVDRYGREVSRCEVAGRDVGATLVAMGQAFAYTDYSIDYVPQERAAERAGLGLWQGGFDYPWDYRREAREVAAEADPAPQGCAVKGNVSASGRIYHLPAGRSYAATRIDEGRGERWFCSEAEALAAGWRAARG